MNSNFKTYLESKGHSNQSTETHYRNLLAFINWCEDENIEEPEQATYPEILSYIKHIQKREIKQRTIQIYIGSLKHYFSWLIKREIREDNPTRNIDIKGVKRMHLYDILKKQELETLYENFELPQENEKNTCPEYNRRKNQNWFKTSILASKRNKVILGLMIWQGLGTKDLSGLLVKDVKLREGKIYIAGTRRSNERELKLESLQVLDLMEYVLQTRKELIALTNKITDQLFISTGNSEKFSNVMSILMKKLNQQNRRITSTKQIRASVITHWLKNYNLRETQYMAGHRYVSSTESYLINDLDDLQEDITKYHPIG